MLLLGARCQDASEELIQEAQGCFLSLQGLPTLEGQMASSIRTYLHFFLRSNWRGEENLENGIFPESPAKHMFREEKDQRHPVRSVMAAAHSQTRPAIWPPDPAT